MKLKTVPLSVKVGTEDGLADGEFVVYPSTFTKTPDSYGDIVKPGAFLDDIAAWKASGNVMPALYGHRMDDPDFFVGSALEMSEDDHGWRVKGKFDLESPKGPTVYKLVKGRRLNSMSFAYDTQDEGQVELDGGVKANELRKLKVFEFSFVPVGANSDASVVAVKAAVDSLASSLKVGAVISADNLATMRDIHKTMSGAVTQMDTTLSAMCGGKGTTEPGKQASGTDPAK